MREISLDTETTGLSLSNGDRITEIGCVEIIDKKITGRNLHLYINPEREVSATATEISGLTYSFLKQFKTFSESADEFLDFIASSRLVIHNAPFDIGFLNFELSKAGKHSINPEHVVDTLIMSKQKFPGSPATLDALCRRFSVDSSARTKHGALIDAELLAEVYIHMSVERLQRNIFAESNDKEEEKRIELSRNFSSKNNIQRNFQPTSEELAIHLEFLKKFKDPIWNKFIGKDKP